MAPLVHSKPHGTTSLSSTQARSIEPGQTSGDSRATVRTYVLVFLGAVAFAILLRTFVIHAYRIPSSSMEGTLLVGDYLLAERVTYGTTLDLPWSEEPILRLAGLRRPERGEIVIFRSWDGQGRELVKRCVGLPGDTVEVADAVLLVNGQPFDSLLAGRRARDNDQRPSVEHAASGRRADRRQRADHLRDFGPHVVQPGHVFVVGDNRDNSDDSRSRGDVPFAALRARPLFIYWSVEAGRSSRNPLARVRWSRIGHVLR